MVELNPTGSVSMLQLLHATKTNQRNINTCNMTPAVRTIHSFEGGMKYSYKGQCVSLMCIHFKDVHKVHVAFVQHIL